MTDSWRGLRSSEMVASPRVPHEKVRFNQKDVVPQRGPAEPAQVHLLFPQEKLLVCQAAVVQALLEKE